MDIILISPARPSIALRIGYAHPRGSHCALGFALTMIDESRRPGVYSSCRFKAADSELALLANVQHYSHKAE